MGGEMGGEDGRSDGMDERGWEWEMGRVKVAIT